MTPAQPSPNAGEDLIVVLVRPKHPGNIGAVARVMDNFGLRRLWLVGPSEEWQGKEARDRASHGKPVLAAARVVTWREVESADLVVGTTARLGTDYNLTRTPLTPEMLSAQLPKSPARDIALVFGPEDHGLSNDELMACDVLVTIPAPEATSALNLSHAVAIIIYALCARPRPLAQFAPMTAADKAQLAAMTEAAIAALDFLPPSKAATQRKLWRRLLGKAFLTRREAFALMGFFSQLQRKLRSPPSRARGK